MRASCLPTNKGFAEIIQHREIGNACPRNVFEELDSSGELEVICARELVHPQVSSLK